MPGVQEEGSRWASLPEILYLAVDAGWMTGMKHPISTTPTAVLPLC
jgi:hypothetical protein